MDGFRYDTGQDNAIPALEYVGYRFWEDSSTPTLKRPLGKDRLGKAS
jgi:hypothetical protein